MDYGDAALLELVAEVMPLLDIVQFRGRLLSALLEAVPAKYASLNEVARDRVIAAISRPQIARRFFAKFEELGVQNPLYNYHARTGDGRAYRFSDVATREELANTRLYREIYEPLGVNHQIAFTLPSEAGRVLGVALSRADADFSDDERAFLNRARPYLIQAYRNSLGYSGRRPAVSERLAASLVAAGLTEREADAVRAIALGASNEHAGDELGISARTVQKHLEKAFPKLGVVSRSDAAARAWELAGGTAD